ncbi:unnamed protein product [Mytilus edulis]|uniref:Uncharacterized protein n=1 Tax=Mytilus edulis TaxID=6550 RepID=A0A8S3PWY8_MYTED|nr:unnamed protein product [Mytilus edulis]
MIYPYNNCFQGHEIHPCTIEYKQDICKSCPDGLVQPNLISSSPNGNPNDTECFAPVKKCDSDGKDSKGVPEVQISTIRTTRQLVKLSLSLSTPSQSSKVSVYPQHNDKSDNTPMIIIVAILSVAVVVLLIVALCIWRTTEHFMCQFNMCFNHAHHDPIVPPPEEIPLNQVGNGDVQEVVDNRTTEGGRPTATPTDNGNSEIYRDQATSNLYQKKTILIQSPHVECVTGKCTTDQSLASGSYITMNA